MMNPDDQVLGVVGCGTMGRAVAEGLLSDSTGWTVRATVRSPASAAALADELGIEVGQDNLALAKASDVVVLAVKPQAAAAVLRVDGMADALRDCLLVSLCAGVTTSQLERWLPHTRVVRAMPNTPAVIHEGMTVITPGARSTDADLVVVQGLFERLGRCLVLEEKHLDAVTGLSGSGPAFACVVLEALADGGVMMGLPRPVAIELAAQTVQGAARLVLATGEHPAALRDRVTTPAGCTIAGLFKMEEGRIRSTLATTVQVAAQVASGLGQDGEDR